MSDSKDVKKGNEDEISDILGQLKETDKPKAKTPPAQKQEVKKEPMGLDDQPEDIEGMLEKISEKPEKDNLWQRFLGFFKKLFGLS